jgi:dTDP-4-dehydrorhamnose reductase
MRVAVTGTTGRVGTALARWFSAAGHAVVELPRSGFDLEFPERMRAVLDGLEVDVFLHPAGITSVDAAEEEPARAMRVNGDAAGEIAEWAAANGVKLVYFSTDYVFGGESPGLRTEGDAPGPLGAYGVSKLAGERRVLAVGEHLVCRVSWVFGPEKASFIDQVMADALAGRPLAAVGDKVSLPTRTSDLCGWVAALLEQSAGGVVHLCNPGEPVSWHGLAERTVAAMADCGALACRPQVAALELAGVSHFRAPRPRFTAMATERLAGIAGSLVPWTTAVDEYVRQQCG